MIIVVLVLALIFGFNDKQPIFNINHWLLNLLRLGLLSAIALFIHELAHKLIAKQHGCKTESEIWGITQIGFKRTAKISGFLKSLPVGIILPLLVMLFSKGQFYFAGVKQTTISTNPESRIGKKYTRLMNFEIAKIAASGPIASILFALLIKSLNIPALNDLVLISVVLAVSNILPLPKLDGSECLFGSKTLFIFTFFFVIISSTLIFALSSIATLVVSILLAILFLAIISYFYIFTKS